MNLDCHLFFSTGNTANVPEPQPCQWGHYCPPQTTRPDQWPCPAGTFTISSSLSDASQCTPCTPGSYCSGKVVPL